MKYGLQYAAVFSVFLFSFCVFAQSDAPSAPAVVASPAPAVVALPIPAVIAKPSPSATPKLAVIAKPSPSATPKLAVIAKPSPSATPMVVIPMPTDIPFVSPSVGALYEPVAPQWTADVIAAIQKLPILGPIVSHALVYVGILSVVLTSLTAFLLSLLTAFSGAFNLAGFAGFAVKLQAFKDGPVIYWLKYLSMFNAQKPNDETSLADQVVQKSA